MTITSLSSQGRRVTSDRSALLTPALRETARVETNRWIKRLRLVRYGAASMRERFSYRGGSLWWFTELYLHKMRRLESAVETILALDHARAAGAAGFVVETRDEASRQAAAAFGVARGIPVSFEGVPSTPEAHRWPSALVGWTSRLSRLRPAGPRQPPVARGGVAAFVHTAFWRTTEPEQETYIGPVLDAIIARAGRDRVRFVGLGPRRNFRARRWWDPMTAPDGPTLPITAIERFAPASSIRGSIQLWQERHHLADAVVDGGDIRDAASFSGCDLWPVLRHELRGVALIQWPWSARSMDEAGAAIDALEPGVVVTYAEAGGWGRALMMEARRRAVPSVGIQHGFIYRHWLNYQHEPDEMAPSGSDPGFPRPDRTLVYDDYAAAHLATAGSFPETSLVVTGSARLEMLTAKVVAMRAQRDEIRRRIHVSDQQPLAVLAAKFSEVHAQLPALIEAVSALANVKLVIKTHPAETAELYGPAAAAARGVEVLPASADLAEVTAAADLIITMNSTVAIDALGLGLPALVIGLPNNLSPFVEAGVMIGATGAAEIQQALESVLYDRQVREALAERAGAFVARYGLAARSGAADRAANEILGTIT